MAWASRALFLELGFGFNRSDVYSDLDFERPPSLAQVLASGGLGVVRLARNGGGGVDVTADLTFFSAPDNPNVPPPVPEPDTSSLLIAGLAAVAHARRAGTRL